IKETVERSQTEMLVALGKPVPAKMEQELTRYEKEKEEIAEKAKEKAEKSEHLLARHERFSVAVTFFQVAIGVAAISVLTRRRRFFYASLFGGAAGVIMLVVGFLVRI
ncbi:MAG: DUF4337 family protein, partial [Bdellovibrionota bacterium]